MARKDEILDALIDIFRTKGVGSDFTISELAKKVNIGKSTIYEYFSTKDDIMKESIYRVIETSVSSVFEKQNIKHDSFEIAFKEEMKFIIGLALNSKFLFAFITPEFKQQLPEHMRADIMERMQSVANHYEKTFRDIFLKGVEEGVLSKDNLLINSLLVSSLITGSVMRLGNAKTDTFDQLDIDEYIDALFNAAVKISN